MQYFALYLATCKKWSWLQGIWSSSLQAQNWRMPTLTAQLHFLRKPPISVQASPKSVKPETGFSGRMWQFFGKQSQMPTCENSEGLCDPGPGEHRKLPHCQWGPGQIPRSSWFSVFLTPKNILWHKNRWNRSTACKLLRGMWLDEPQSKNIETAWTPQAPQSIFPFMYILYYHVGE